MKSDQIPAAERHRRFVDAYLIKPHATEAAIAAGYSAKSAHVQGCKLLKDPKIQEMIETGANKVAEAAKFEAVDVLRHWVDIATADPTKIANVRRVNCRHCWGVGHAYQWKSREYAEACDRGEMPKCDGGFGFVRNKPPHPECPECDGDGIEETFFQDMSKLDDRERRLVASVKRTKDGLEVKTRDQDGALAKIAGYLGMLVDKKEITGKDGGPLAVATIPVDLPGDPTQLAALYGKIL